MLVESIGNTSIPYLLHRTIELGHVAGVDSEVLDPPFGWHKSVHVHPWYPRPEKQNISTYIVRTVDILNIIWHKATF